VNGTDDGSQLAVCDDHAYRQLITRARPIEQGVQGELEIFEMLERQIEAHREPAQHEVGDAVECVVCRQRQADLVNAQVLPPV